MANGTAAFTQTVKPEWIDHNNHMTFWAYNTLFEQSAKAYFAGHQIVQPTGPRPSELRTADQHIRFFRECFAGDPLTFEVQILGYDEKHIHLFQRMRNQNDGQLLAVETCLKTNLGGSIKLPFIERERAFQPDVLERIAHLAKEHEGMPRPAELGAATRTPAA